MIRNELEEQIKNEYVHWACGNALKYIFRWEKKNGLEDLKKARKNLDFAIETLESGCK